jgi:hypothetical protein
MNTKQSYNIILGPTGSSGPVGVTGIPDKRWIRIIKIGKMLKLWEN